MQSCGNFRQMALSLSETCAAVQTRPRRSNQNRDTRFATAVYQMKISGDRMTLQELGGSKLEFTRIKETDR